MKYIIYLLVFLFLTCSCSQQSLECIITKEKKRRNKESVVVQEQKIKPKEFSLKQKYNNRNKKQKG